jgi:hypothetical protein
MSSPAGAAPGSAFISFSGLTALPPTDDGSSLQTPLGFPMDYFGTDYSSVYVNANGNLTFTGPLSSYTPSGIGSVGTDIIAPFFSDVDTLYGNPFQYGESTLDGHPVFVAEWPYVDCYQDSTESSSVTDDFQVILIDRSDLGAGDFQIEYNYDQIQWDAGQASNGTTSDPICQSTVNADAAVVGFSNKAGTESYELPGSQTDGAFIDSNSSTGLIYNDVNSDTAISVPASASPVQGRYIWEVENGSLGTPTALSGSLTSTSGSGTSITVSPGTAVSATASLLGDNVGSAGGTVSYTVYSGSGCTGSVYESAGSGNVTDGSVGASSSVSITAPGTYSWYASYSGDRSNNQGSAACIGTETVVAGTTTTAANATTTFSASSQLATLSATVTSGAGTVNEGTVTFTVEQGMTVIGTPTTSGTVTNGAASVSYTLPAGTPAGTYTIDAVYNPGADFTGSSDATHTLTVAPPVTLSPATLPGTTINTPYNQTITVSGGTTPVALVVSNITNAIPGLVIPASGTGMLVLSGTPTATGTETFTVTATDAVGATGSQSYSITVAPPVMLSPATLPGTTINTPYNQTITVSGGTTPVALVVSNVTNAIPGLVIPASGTGMLVLSGTPTATGTETFTVTATDAVGATASQSYSITVASGGGGGGGGGGSPTPTSFTITVNGSSSATITEGQTATLGDPGLPSTATGTVTFVSGSTVLCSFSLSVTTSSCLTSPSLGAGTYPITANFVDTDGNFANSTSTNSVTLTVNPTPPVTPPTPPITPPTPPITPPTPPPTTPGGYDLVGSDGGVFVFGNPTGFFGSLPGIGVHVTNIVGMVPTGDDLGYFLVGSDGGVFAFGDAPFEGSLPGIGVHVGDIVGIIPTQDDKGYFLVGKDGGVFAFGDAPYEGSLPGMGTVVSNIVGIAATPSDQGYWVVGSDGHVYAFGNATNYGSATGPVTAIAATPDGGGYWLTGPDGGVFGFVDAGYFGSLPGLGIHVTNIVSMVPSSDGKGYLLIGGDGGMFAFGDATFLGSLPGLGVHVTNIVGAVPTG